MLRKPRFILAHLTFRRGRCPMSQSRRYFLKSSGIAMASFAAAPSFLLRTAMAQDAPASKDRPILIAVFQRGAADGISVVPPFGDPNYAKARPQIAVPAPNRSAAETAIDLDGYVGFHPRSEERRVGKECRCRC